MKRGRTIGLSILLFSILGAIPAEGCGGSDTSSSSLNQPDVHPSDRGNASRLGTLRAVKWGVGRQEETSIKIGAFVPYCENVTPSPRIERVVRRRSPNRVILTMYVRFPVGQRKGCIGYGLGLTRWISLGRQASRLSIYDGSTPPPALRIRGAR